MASISQLVEGFDHLAAETDVAKLVGKGTSTADGWQGDVITVPESTVDPVTGRDGTGLGIQFATALTARELDFRLRTDVAPSGSAGVPATSNPDGANNGCLCGGFAFRMDDQAGSLGEVAEPFVQFLDTAGSVIVQLALHRSGFLVYDPTNFPTAGLSHSMASTQPLQEDVWHYIQFDFRLGNNQNNNTEFTLWIDGRAQGKPEGEIYALTAGTNTVLSGRYGEGVNLPGYNSTNGLRTVRFVKNNANFGYSIDDLWLSSYLTAYTSEVFAGDPQNGRSYDRDPNPGPIGWGLPLSDPQVRTFFPTAEGATANWTPQAGTDNALMVDDNAHDGDTTYVESTTSAQVDLYTFPNHAADAASIESTWMSANVRDTTSASPNLIFRTRHATIETDFGSEDTTNTAYEQKGVRVRRDVGALPSNIGLTITNPSGESEVTTGAITGWTKAGHDTTGIATENTGVPPTSPPGGGGSNWFSFDGTVRVAQETALLQQDILTSTDSIPDRDIDSGNLTIEWGGQMMEVGGVEDGALEIHFLDANGFEIPHSRRSFYDLVTAGSVWEVETTGDIHVPPGTRTFRLLFGCHAEDASNALIYWDLMVATVKYIDDQSEFTPTESDAGEMGIKLT